MRFWQYFEYDEKSDSSKCVTFDIKKNDACGQVLKGKNETNLKKHINALHPEVFVKLEKNKKNRISNKRKASDMSSSSQEQTIAEFFTRRNETYQSSATEYKARESSLVNFFIDTGYPAI